MSWLTTFSFVMKSNITAIKEKISDPERMIHQLLIDMEHELSTVRGSVANAIADEILLEKKVARAEREAKHWADRAKSAVERDDDTSARAALEQQDSAEERYDSLNRELEQQKRQTTSLKDSVRELEDKIRQARQKQTLLLARVSRAESSQKINQAMAKAGNSSAFAEFKRLEDRVERAEAVTEAYERLDGPSAEAEDLDEQFEAVERKERLEKKLADLKKRVSSS
jgi:phage shock protein A